MKEVRPAPEYSIDRDVVQQYLDTLARLSWGDEGQVAALVETPRPHRHALREEVAVIEGKGFAGDHDEKSFYRGRYVPGREVSAIALDVLRVLGVAPRALGDNLITEGVNLALLEESDLLEVGEVLLERSGRPHNPCRTFRERTSPEAFAVVSKNRYRGALFVVRKGGTIRIGDTVRIVRV